MPVVVSIDIGTSTITALALDVSSGKILAWSTTSNQAETTTPDDKVRGRSEWDIRVMARQACGCLRQVADQLGETRSRVAALGITGQQHGVVVVDAARTPLTPFVNWQDKRGDEIVPGTEQSWVQAAARRVGDEAPTRAGCRLSTGYMGMTLFWLKQQQRLPATGTACFAMDYFAAHLSGADIATDTSCAASSGVLDVRSGTWDEITLAALDLPRSLFPEIGLSGAAVGGLTPSAAEATGLPAGLPVCIGIGDNQAAFLGAVGQRVGTILVNVGTGGQVAGFTPEFAYDPILETRPFPRGGYLLVSAGLSGGAAYAVLERFFRAVGSQLLAAPQAESIYEALNRLAAEVPRGANGLRCEPYFAGTRARPELRGGWSGISIDNFTPAHFTRALLEGMARAFREGFSAISEGSRCSGQRLVGAGNGLRANPVLARIVAEEFGLPLAFPRHREEAAYGAALLAAVAVGLFPDLDAAGRLIQYDDAV